MISEPKCKQEDCFANRDGVCDALIQVQDPCSFYKKDGRITNGKYYPYYPVDANKIDMRSLISKGFMKK